MQDKGFVSGRWSWSWVVAALCGGLLVGCVGGGEAPVPGDGAPPPSTSKALTALPPRVGLTLQDIQDAGSNIPYCRLLRTYVTPQVLQAYYSDQGFDGCVVAWLKRTTVHFPNVMLRAARWDGQRWLPMGDELNEVNSPESVALNPRLSWSAEDRPVLTWDEQVNGGTLHVQRTWDGSVWR
ncbi:MULTISPECIES: hypothetical protein [Myxococcus]|uniref:hypothetical protein n=1 Tax=Myxococcus TaxID=32 RepID=UPI0013D09C98|nr:MULTISPECIES: hypothetical protein [Myxococcus]NVJ20841.1 hypothetical protein [Myxococcus sp. AM011]